MTEILQLLQGTPDTLVRVFIAIVRVAAPLLALVLLFRCIKPLLTFRREPEIWAWLCADDGKQYPLTHWENVVGSNKHCDVVLEKKGISKNHCVFTRYDDGSWTVADADSASTAESLQSMERLMNKQYADLLQKDMAQVEQNMGNLTQVHQKRDLLEEKTGQ